MTSGRILLADDDRAIRESLSRALGLQGYEVVQAPDGAAALAMVEKDTPDVAILDVMMPNVDGLTVCRVLRAERNRLPILMLTARTETADRVAGLDAGADDYLAEAVRARRAARPRARPAAAGQAGRRPGEPTLADTSATCASSRTPAGCGAPDGRSSCPRPSSTCSNCSCATRASCSTTRRSTSGSGATTSGRTRRTWRCTSRYLRRKLEGPGESKLIHTVRGVGYTARAD